MTPMPRLVTFRTDKKTYAKLARLAREIGNTRSAVLRSLVQLAKPSGVPPLIIAEPQATSDAEVAHA